MNRAERIQTFKKTVWNHYKKEKRDLPWRKTKDPYKILVSEIMLQQTQALRVIPKYKSFLKKFPTVQALAKAPLKDVLLLWQGLGYNRRAVYLKKCAEKVLDEFGGKFPTDLKTLCSLPGIGPATAGDLLAFAWNIPVPLIETNIRSVYIHHFFEGARANTHAESTLSANMTKGISDKDLLPLIEETLDMKNPREWYWALFDYGAFLKESGNPNRKSKHYTKQTKFKGSHREKRSQVLKKILEKPHTEKSLLSLLALKKPILSLILLELEKEGMIRKSKGKFVVA